MHPILLEFPFPVVGRLRLYSFGLCVVVGVFAALAVATRLARRRGIDPDRITSLGILTVLIGLAGARLFYFVQFHDQFRTRRLEAKITRVDKGGLDGLLLDPNLRRKAGFLPDESVEVRSRRGRNPVLLPLLPATRGSGEIVLAGPSSEGFAPGDEVELVRERSAWAFFAIWEGGIVYYGGILAGAAAGLLYLLRHRLNVLDVLDAVSPALALGLAVGRIGCFLNGCCFGAICEPSASYAVHFPRVWGKAAEDDNASAFPGLLLRATAKEAWTPAFQHQVKANGLASSRAYSFPVYATQLLAAANSMLLFVLLLLAARHGLPRGSIFWLWLLLYPPLRFVEESLRADNGPALWGLTISQVIGIPLFCVGVAGWILSRRAAPAVAIPSR